MNLRLPLLLLLALQATSALADVDIADLYDARSSASAEAVALAARCIPGTTELAYLKMVRDAGPNSMVAIRPADPLKSYLLVNASRAICVPMSAQKYPILPLESFDATVDFDSLRAEDRRRLTTSLALQIARTGVARALVKNEKGNAYVLTYLLAADRPTKFYYQAAFVKEGDYDETKFEISLIAPGNMAIVSRGQPGEQVKHLMQN